MFLQDPCGASYSPDRGDMLFREDGESSKEGKRICLPDLISSLPDEILISILSHLHTSETVKTCVLSRRWEHLWKWVPVLDFHLNQGKLPNLVEFKEKLRFEDGTQIMRFALSFNRRYKADVVNQHFLLAMQYCPHEIRITDQDYRSDVYELPTSIIRPCSSHLRILSVIGCRINNAAGMDLRCLEQLSLERVGVSKEQLHTLLSTCPNIKVLEMKSIPWETTLCLSFHRLQELSLHCRGQTVVEAPDLRHVHYAGGLHDMSFSQHPELLKEVSLGPLKLSSINDIPLSWDFICRFLRAESMCLKLGWGFKEENSLSRYFLHRAHVPEFHFRRLNMVVGGVQVQLMLPGFLKACPKLEVLQLVFSKYELPPRKYDDMSVFSSADNEDIPCLRHTLRRIEITNFQATDVQLEFAKFVARNALVAEVISFSCFGHLGKLLRTKDVIASCIASKKALFVYD